MKTGIIVQTRMGSSRLPGKVMKKIQGKSVIEHVVERLKQCKEIDDIIIATTVQVQDDIISKQADCLNVKCFRGSEEDVLERYYLAAKENQLDVIVRVTSDCPLIDPIVLDKIVDFFKNNQQYHIISNASSDLSNRTFPRGLDVEVFSFNTLEKAYQNAAEAYQREHVTPYIYENSTSTYYYKNDIDYSMYRWTLDTKEDLELIEQVYQRLYKGKHDFYLQEIVNIFNQWPELKKINQHVEQKKMK